MAASARGRTPLGAGRDLNDRGGRVAVLCPAKAARRASQLLAWPSPWAKEGLLGGLRLDRAKLPVGSGAHSGGSHCQFTFLQKRSTMPLFFGRGCAGVARAARLLLLHRIAKQLTFSNGIPFIFFGHFILVLRFPSSREFQFEICFARSFLCFLNYTLQHNWMCVRSLDPYKLLMFWSPLDLRLRCKFASAKQISNQNSRDEGNLKTENKWTKKMEKNEWNSI